MRQSCIERAKVVVDALRRVGVRAEPLAVKVLTLEGDIAHATCGYSVRELIRILGSESRTSVVRERQRIRQEAPNGYYGHLVARVPEFDTVIDLNPSFYSLPKIGFVAPTCLRFRNFPLDGRSTITQPIGKFAMRYAARVLDDRTWERYYKSLPELHPDIEELAVLTVFLPALATQLSL
jgi:hypothetical protein